MNSENLAQSYTSLGEDTSEIAAYARVAPVGKSSATRRPASATRMAAWSLQGSSVVPKHMERS